MNRCKYTATAFRIYLPLKSLIKVVLTRRIAFEQVDKIPLLGLETAINDMIDRIDYDNKLFVVKVLYITRSRWL